MSKYIWRSIFRDKLKNKFLIDKNGFIKYPAEIDQVLNIIEDAIREEDEAQSEKDLV